MTLNITQCTNLPHWGKSQGTEKNGCRGVSVVEGSIGLSGCMKQNNNT